MQTTKEPAGGFAASLLEYLYAVRNGVCSRCGGRSADDPRGNPCGTVLPLGQLIEALERAEGRPPCPDGAGYCPCPMERLAALAADAAEDLDKKRRAGA
jgi:hypothetical protein